MKTTRTFIAIDIEPAVRNSARDIGLKLGDDLEAVTLVDPQRMHLTLKFLGDVEDLLLVDICAAAKEVAAEVEPFSVEFAGIGAFPNLQRPRTLWVGVANGQEWLAEMQGNLDQLLSSLGIRPESRPFHPHLTLGRVKFGGEHIAMLQQRVEALDPALCGASFVEELIVYSSELHSEGPHYQVIGRGKLGG